MKKIINIASVALAITIIVSVIAVPAVASLNALTHTAGYEISERPKYFYAWATLTYSGGNGNKVHAFAYATTNLGYTSIINDYPTAISATYKGPEKEYKLEIPFIAEADGDVYYYTGTDH